MIIVYVGWYIGKIIRESKYKKSKFIYLISLFIIFSCELIGVDKD